MKRFSSLLAILACLALVAAACSGEDGGTATGGDAVVVDGHTVSTSTLDDELDYLADQPTVATNLIGASAPEGDTDDTAGEGDEPNEEERWRMVAAGGLLTVHVLTVVLDEVVEQEGFEVEAEDTDEAEQLVGSIGGEFDPETGQLEGGEDATDDMPDSLREDLIRLTSVQYALERHLMEAQGGEVTDEDVEAAYEEQIAGNEDFDEYACSSHVLIAFDDDPQAAQEPEEPSEEREQETLEAAEAVVERLDSGEDFAEVAEDVSDDVGSAENGGSLNCNMPGQFVPEFEEALYDLEEGSYTDPVRTQFGYHVILLESLGAPDFEEVEEDLRASLEQEAGDITEAFLEVVQGAAEEMEVEVDPRFGTWDAEELRVVPPEGAEDPPVGPGGEMDLEELMEDMDVEELMEGMDPEQLEQLEQLEGGGAGDSGE